MFTTIQSHYTLNSIQMQMQILRQSIGFHTYFFFLKCFCWLFWLAKTLCTASGTYNHIVWTEYKSRQQ